MMKLKYTYLLFALFMLVSCRLKDKQETVLSPDGKIEVKIETVKGQVYFSAIRNKEQVIGKSKLGYQFKNLPNLGNQVEIVSVSRRSANETWEQVWGEKRLIEYRYNEIEVQLKERAGNERLLVLRFMVFDDGLGFRYEIPEQANLDTLIITDELTEFNLPGVNDLWWIPAYKEVYYESLYRNTAFNFTDTICTPVTIRLSNGSFMAIHEANLTDYAALNLYISGANTLKADLTPWSTGEKVFTRAGMVSPWRTVTLADSPGGLVTSYIALNLNEPSKIEDTSWIKPGKYIGIWWSMHLGINTWSQGPLHGATTKNTKRYIDFAAENGFDGVLVEGWNYGWDGDWVNEGDKFSFTKNYPDFDLKEVTRYAHGKNVKLIGHHETGGAVLNYENQLEEAFALYQQVGVNAVKTGYVRPKLESREFHSSQFGVRHYRKVLETAAKYQIMIDNHEPAMPTGLQRTYPNLMTQEGVRGQEYDAWSKDGGNPPDHTTILPFTRGLAGPMDFTPGTFNFNNPVNPGTRVQTTIAKQLALYVVIYSPLQMASDLPENYKDKKEFDFIKMVPVDWDLTLVPQAEIGDYVVTVRKDRNSANWYLGAITDENARELAVALNFLEADKTYRAEIYRDGKNASWKDNPNSFEYIEMQVSKADSLLIKMAAGGGQAIRFVALN